MELVLGATGDESLLDECLGVVLLKGEIERHAATGMSVARGQLARRTGAGEKAPCVFKTAMHASRWHRGRVHGTDAHVQAPHLHALKEHIGSILADVGQSSFHGGNVHPRTELG